MASQKMNDLPGDQAACFLSHKSTVIGKSLLRFSSATSVDDILVHSKRNNRTTSNYQWLISRGCIRLVNSCGESKSGSNWLDAIISAVVNKRAGGGREIILVKHFSGPLPGELNY